MNEGMNEHVSFDETCRLELWGFSTKENAPFKEVALTVIVFGLPL